MLFSALALIHQEFTEIYPDNSNSGSWTPLGCDPISSSFCIIGKNTKTNTGQHYISLMVQRTDHVMHLSM